MSTDVPLLPRLLVEPAAEAWRLLFSHAWDVFSKPAPDAGPRAIIAAEKALHPVDLCLESAAWDLWDGYGSAVERTSNALAAWWSQHSPGRAVLILDGLSLRELPWLISGAKANSFVVADARVTGSELPGTTDAFARALGFGQRSELQSDGLAGRTTRLPGAHSECCNYPWSDALGLLSAEPDLVFWHEWPDSSLHELKQDNRAYERLLTSAQDTLRGDEFWSFVRKLATGRRLVITSDHGYAHCGSFPDANEEQTDHLKTVFGASRYTPAPQNVGNGPWLPPLERTVGTAGGASRVVLGRRKWKVQGGHPKLAHGGLTLLEVAVPFIELTLPTGG